MLEMLSHAGIHSLLSMIVAVLPLGAGIAYLVRPSEQRLALMRPLSLAGIFAGLSGTVGGFLQLWHRGHVSVRFHHIIEEASREHHALTQQLPIDGAIGSAVLVKID